MPDAGYKMPDAGIPDALRATSFAYYTPMLLGILYPDTGIWYLKSGIRYLESGIVYYAFPVNDAFIFVIRSAEIILAASAIMFLNALPCEMP